MLNATLVSRTEITPDLLILGVKPDSGVPDFLPGQYVALGLPANAPRPDNFPPPREDIGGDKLIKRAYSIGSSPLDKEQLEFYLAVVRDGCLTARLALLKVGERLFLAPKIVGTFTLAEVPADHNLVLVSTGTGLAPYISMLRTASTWTNDRNITLIHGVRYVSDLAYRDEIARLSQEHAGKLKYYPVVSRPDKSWQGLQGYVQHLFRAEGIASASGEHTVIKLNSALDHVFLCGNPAMVEESENFLVSHGYSVHSKKNPGNLHLEKYW